MINCLIALQEIIVLIPYVSKPPFCPATDVQNFRTFIIHVRNTLKVEKIFTMSCGNGIYHIGIRNTGILTIKVKVY